MVNRLEFHSIIRCGKDFTPAKNEKGNLKL